jgi:hypothetical protein
VSHISKWGELTYPHPAVAIINHLNQLNLH